MPKRRIGPFAFGWFPNDERCWVPRFGILNTRPTEWSGLFIEDGKLEIYAYWAIFEVAVRLRTRVAKGIRGSVEAGEK